jgi:hypothetical protein
MSRRSLRVINPLKKLTPGESVFKNLKGLICLYKPPDYDVIEIINKLKYSFVHGINLLPCRPVEKMVKIDETSGKMLEPVIADNLADSVEAVGPRYIRRDFKIDFLHPLDKHDSGVLSIIINLKQIRSIN